MVRGVREKKWDTEIRTCTVGCFEQSHVAGKKGGRFFPYPECPDGPIEPKEQKKRAAEIQRKKAEH